ncbi:MAG: 2-dehydropantoate 2-reductase [Ectobacillus sp.]
MKIGVVGPGAVGLLFSYYLRKAAGNVTVYTRTQEQAEYIRMHGITCRREGWCDTVFPDARELDGAVLADDYLFVAVKQYDLEALFPRLHKSESRLVFLQNGMSHILLLQHMQNKKAAVGIVEHGAKKESTAAVKHTGIGTTRFGIINGALQDFQALFPLFSAPLFSMCIEEEWEAALTRKLIINACINPLTALYKVRNGELVDNEHFCCMMKRVFAEVLSVVEVCDEKEQWQHVCEVARKTAHNHSSMLVDLSLGRATEVEAILGYVLKQAKEKEKELPLVSFLYHSIKGLER